jgi:hypothetical protein
MNRKQADVRAIELLQECGVSSHVLKDGATAVLRELKERGIEPCRTELRGAGISFWVSAADAKRVLSEVCPIPLPDEVPESAHAKQYGKERRAIRTIARAVLDLYERLGEEPEGCSNLRKLAERD